MMSSFSVLTNFGWSYKPLVVNVSIHVAIFLLRLTKESEKLLIWYDYCSRDTQVIDLEERGVDMFDAYRDLPWDFT
jgi:hypothetical protein